MAENQNGSPIADPNVIPKVPVPVQINVGAVHDLESGEGYLMFEFNTNDVHATFFVPGTHATKLAHDIQIKANQASIRKPPGGLVIP